MPNSLETLWDSYCGSKAQESAHIISAAALAENHRFDCSNNNNMNRYIVKDKLSLQEAVI